VTFWTLDRLSQALASDLWGARLRGSAPLGGVSTDTRSLQPGDVFVALRGERFDAHDFLAAAITAGASALVVADPKPVAASGLPVLAVNDTLVALASLGRFRRRAWGGPLVAIAGSNGKSSTKELVRAALGAVFDVHATSGNLNNFIGVPLTLLGIPDHAQVAVVEIGTNHPGEVEALRAVAEPEIGVVTSIGEEHLEGLGDLAGVLQEESAVYRDVALAIAPAEQPEVAAVARTLARRTVEAGIGAGDVRPDDWGLESDGRAWLLLGGERATLPFRGAHSARNAMLALAVARAFGVPDDLSLAGMSRATPLPMRGAWETIGELTVMNDAYNANPPSVRESLALLQALDAGRPHVVVLGSMLELGERSAQFHREMADRALATSAIVVAGIGAFQDALAEVGKGDARVVVAADVDALWERLRPRLPVDAIVLLKGSRGVRLERLMPKLRAFAGAPDGATAAPDHPPIR
jgi:UDP-N-acetylmuramoyl-tripeptide--D-alanyl-D-alanine ligase